MSEVSVSAIIETPVVARLGTALGWRLWPDKTHFEHQEPESEPGAGLSAPAAGPSPDWTVSVSRVELPGPERVRWRDTEWTHHLDTKSQQTGDAGETNTKIRVSCDQWPDRDNHTQI